MAIYQHATLDRDKALAERIDETYDARERLARRGNTAELTVDEDD